MEGKYFFSFNYDFYLRRFGHSVGFRFIRFLEDANRVAAGFSFTSRIFFSTRKKQTNKDYFYFFDCVYPISNRVQS